MDSLTSFPETGSDQSQPENDESSDQATTVQAPPNDLLPTAGSFNLAKHDVTAASIPNGDTLANSVSGSGGSGGSRVVEVAHGAEKSNFLSGNNVNVDAVNQGEDSKDPQQQETTTSADS